MHIFKISKILHLYATINREQHKSKSINMIEPQVERTRVRVKATNKIEPPILEPHPVAAERTIGKYF